jgi:hypothetical protein
MDEDFLYHRVVPNLRGTILYPLNRLKEIYPDAYVEHLRKYEGREHVLETRIPSPLNCLWNDALHFTAVPPTTLEKNLREVGFDTHELVWKKWFKIPAKLLDPTQTIVCLYRRDLRLAPDAHDFQPYDKSKINEYQTVPKETIAYYKEKFAAKERPLFFHFVPHILYKGALETSQLEIVQL